MNAPDVAVAGGGVIGLSVAWHSARRGLSVVLVDEEPGRSASWAAAGMLAPVTEVHFGEEELLRLNLASAEMYGQWVEELEEASGMSVGYRQTGTLMVARDADENAALDEVFDYQVKLGLDAERLKSKECRSIEPGLATSVRGGIYVRGDHQVDNRALVSALMEACTRAGVEFVRARVDRVTGGATASGVTLADGSDVECPSVVLAAGPWTNRIGGLAEGAIPPIRPVKGQLLHLRGRPNATIPQRTIRGVDVYVVPRADGRVIVGATVEEQGFDTTITAGAVFTLLRDAYELLPGIAELELTEVACGLRPASKDNSPMIGPTEVPGLSVATAHFRNGVLLAPVTGELMAEHLAEGSVSSLMQPFLPERFAPAGRAAS